MFETDEWSIDEDYLKDFNVDDVIKDCNSQRKNEIEKQKKSANTSRFEYNCSSKNELSAVTEDAMCVDTTSRKNAILNVFKNDVNVKTNVPLNNFATYNTNQTVPAKNIASNFRSNLCQGNEGIVSEKNFMKHTVVAKSVLRNAEETNKNHNQLFANNENQLKRKNNIAYSEVASQTNCAKKKCDATSNVLSNATKAINSIQNNNVPSRTDIGNLANQNHENDNQKQTIVDLLRHPVDKIKKLVKINAPQAVTRKFPGPAGLLPDDINDSDVIDLESIVENENNKMNKYVDICSQNTKNLFSSGAWQLMTDDLPANFELCDIATIKENALKYSKTCKKIPYLAGIIQCIDYKPNDPKVILKDLTGKIDARIHHSICKLYPDVLGAQIVILLKDVGLFVTSKKYICLIISPKNLVSIYSDHARLIKTPHLEKLLGNNESQISLLNEDDKNDREQNEKILLDNSNKQQAKDNDQLYDLQDFDFDENDSWLATNVDDLNSFKHSQFPSSTPMDFNKSNNAVNQSKSTVKNANDSSRLKTLRKEDKRKESKVSTKKDSKGLINYKKNANIFMDDKDDSDDEMLSQLDVDAIAASYHR